MCPRLSYQTRSTHSTLILAAIILFTPLRLPFFQVPLSIAILISLIPTRVLRRQQAEILLFVTGVRGTYCPRPARCWLPTRGSRAGLSCTNSRVIVTSVLVLCWCHSAAKKHKDKTIYLIGLLLGVDQSGETGDFRIAQWRNRAVECPQSGRDSKQRRRKRTARVPVSQHDIVRFGGTGPCPQARGCFHISLHSGLVQRTAHNASTFTPHRGKHHTRTHTNHQGHGQRRNSNSWGKEGQLLRRRHLQHWSQP